MGVDVEAGVKDCLCSGLEGREGGENGACDRDRDLDSWFSWRAKNGSNPCAVPYTVHVEFCNLAGVKDATCMGQTPALSHILFTLNSANC
jgi:hypothetical protein